MSQSDCNGCREYQELTRRQFLAATGGTAMALSIPAWLPRVAYAQDFASRDIVISIFLRGASDGLTMCVPYAENAYYTARPDIAGQPTLGVNIPRPDDTTPENQPYRAIPLADSTRPNFFGLPPAMSSLQTAYNNGNLLFVHACGSTDSSRSHFDAQRYMEVGKPADSTLFTGWLGRHIFSIAPLVPTAMLRAVGLSSTLQRSLQGAPLTLPIPDLDAFGLLGTTSTNAARSAAITDLYNLCADSTQPVAQNTINTINLLNTINFAGYAPANGAVYPSGTSGLGYSLKATAALIKADVGVEAVAIDVGGWDTHSNQGSRVGTMANLMTTLSNSLAAFHLDMFAGSTARNVTVVVMSEFGRRFVANASFGLDHGHGNVMMLLGNHITGGRVLTNWPGLANNQLYQGLDLQVTIDFRDILAEIVQNRLGNSNLSYVFPGYTPTFRGVTRVQGDMNCDGVLNSTDVAPFVQSAIDPAGYAASNPRCNPNAGDFTADGIIDGEDVGGMTRKLMGF